MLETIPKAIFHILAGSKTLKRLAPGAPAAKTASR